MQPLRTEPRHTASDLAQSQPKGPDIEPSPTTSSSLGLQTPLDDRMEAIVYREYGSSDVLRLESVDKPVASDTSVLVKVHAAAANPYDWHFMRGEPYFMRLMIGLKRPKATRLGVDFAGRVEAVGRKVEEFQPGDLVFGAGQGAFAQYLDVPASQVALMPSNLSFEQAAAVPLAGLTALQALRDIARLQPQQKVLVIGASGGVGTFAVQIAKAFGARVTGVCSTRNVEMVRSIGADHVIDYTRLDFQESGRSYDVILQLAGMLSPSRCVRSLSPKGTLIHASGDSTGRWIGPMGRFLRAAALSTVVDQTLRSQTTQRSRGDLAYLSELIEAGMITPIIDRIYQLDETSEAIRYLEQGHARGKVVITVEDQGDQRP